MSIRFEVIGTCEITCMKCGCKTSIKKILIDEDTNRIISEFGECQNCGEGTYRNQYGTLQSSTNPTVKCPYCGSKSTKKISTLSRMGSFATLGFAGKKVGKQWHCNNCKSDF